MSEEINEKSADGQTQPIENDDPEMTVPISVPPKSAVIPIGGAPGKSGKKVDNTDTGKLPSYDFSATLQTSSRVLNRLLGKKLRNVDDEIASDGKSKDDELPLWDGSDDGLGDVGNLYEKREEFAGGGQGIVSIAFDRSLHRLVALKSLRKEHLDKSTSRKDFVREARITATLDHPAIVPVYHLGGDEEHGLHLAMKILHGISLKKYLEEVCNRYQSAGVHHFDESESLHHRLDIFLQVCDAMEYVHNKKVIHGDLKPENIMIGEYHECYIMDWGIARPADGDAVKPEDARIVGTPRYIAPELLFGGPDGIQTDIYSLGVILFELVTLRAAFSGADTKEILAKVKRGEFNPLRHRFHARIPRDLAAIVRKAVAMDRNKRYRTVGELSEDIRRFLRGQEVSANPDGLPGKIVRWANHHNKALLLLMLFLVFATIAASTIGMLDAAAKNAEKKRRDSEAERFVYAKARENVVGMQMLLNHISGELAMLNSDAALLLSLPPSPGAAVSPDFCPVSEVRSRCAKTGNCFIPDVKAPVFFTYGFPLYFGGVSYLLPKGADQNEAMHDLARLSPVIPRLKRTVLDSGLEIGSGADDKLKIEAYKKGKLPVLNAYFSLHKSGLHLNFPGKNDYSPDYDPRKRPWYENALGKGVDPIWSMPYHATGAKRTLMITASVELLDGQNCSYGVAGVDVPLTIFEQFMTANPDAGFYTMQRMLVDAEGRIVLQADGSGTGIEMHPMEENANGEARLQKFPNEAVLQNIRKRLYGGISVQEEGKTVLYVFSGIPAVKWFYVERLDWEKLLRYPGLTY